MTHKISLEDFDTNERYDVITLFGVLEHVNNPTKLLFKAKELLNDNGLIVFEVPSADCVLMRYLRKSLFSPYRYIEHTRHLSFFSRQSLYYMCDQLELEIIDVKSVGFDLQTILLDGRKELPILQEILNEMNLADHYRVFVRRKYADRNNTSKSKL